jgi:DNA-binding response OmpR family regulator
VRILVADDNRDAADSLAILLRIAGHEVQVAYDGAAAVLVADWFHPRLALLDIGMPELDGHDVARKLRQRTDRDTLYLVALTGWGQPRDRLLAHEAGFDEHFVKPIEHDQLDELIQRVQRWGSLQPG